MNREKEQNNEKKGIISFIIHFGFSTGILTIILGYAVLYIIDFMILDRGYTFGEFIQYNIGKVYFLFILSIVLNYLSMDSSKKNSRTSEKNSS